MTSESDSPGMSILEHIEDLRRRLIRAIIALAVGIVVGSFFTPLTLETLAKPTKDLGIELQALRPTESTAVFFKVAIVIGTVLAMPVIVYQLFLFVAPGLESREKRYVLIGAPLAALSFATGVLFAAYILLPAALPFLTGFLSTVVKNQYSIDYYISFVSNIMVWAGLVFETPLVMYFLAKLGVVDHRGFAKARRLVVVGAAAGAAIVTPTTDPLNMMLVMVPFMLLYEFGILLARIAV
ncbi:MAG: twin-arginine translocase subunit TatC [Chloroflexi bacterium]|nr:twin-arginine translocase subunit TatC [Chloroflexota bacterium]